MGFRAGRITTRVTRGARPALAEMFPEGARRKKESAGGTVLARLPERKSSQSVFTTSIPANATVKLNLRHKIWAPNRDLIFWLQGLGSRPDMSGAGPEHEDDIG